MLRPSSRVIHRGSSSSSSSAAAGTVLMLTLLLLTFQVCDIISIQSGDLKQTFGPVILNVPSIVCIYNSFLSRVTI